MNTRTTLSLVLVSLVVSAVACLPARGDDLTTQQEAMTEKALKWLVKQQHRDGHWEAPGGQYAPPVTALAGLALLMEGSSQCEGKYAPHIRKAVEWLTAQSQPNGLIGSPEDPGQSGRYMFSHGYGQLFLAQVYDKERDADRRRKLEDVLTRSVRFSAKAQTSLGGWGYVSATDGADFDHNPNTVVQLQALRALLHAGIPVPKEVLDKAEACLKKSTNERGGVVYSLAAGGGGDGRPAITAAALAAWPGDYDSDLTRRWLNFCKANLPLPNRNAGRVGYDEFTAYYYGQVVYRLGEEGYARLFPNSKRAERLDWPGYRKGMCEFLEPKQKEDGSWNLGQLGPVYSTVCYLAVLQLDRRVLSFYQR